jgi:alkylated DNA nucleotide flippase Atl1
MASARRKSWREKLADNKGLPKTGRITGRMTKRWGTGTMVIPAPLEVDAIMRRVPKGKLITISEIRAALAKKHGVEVCCPITTGIFAWIAANAAAEAAADSAAKTNSRAKKNPYWRTLKTGGELNPKYPGGITQLRKLLAAEGHKVIPKGKRFFVADFEASLASVR